MARERILRLNMDEMFCRIYEALGDVKRPTGATPEQAVVDIETSNPVVYMRVMRAANSCATYIEEQLAKSEEVH